MHLDEALRLFSDRNKPNYRNSIKESISAVEHIVRKITGDTRLGYGLKELEKLKLIPPILKVAFEKLYAYTNDENGIRHALMDDKENVTSKEAKFMLVACSAFINYLKMVDADKKSKQKELSD
ncbi:MAG: hypothetical protein LBT58_00795 [Endomicrobium sp.]|nr:hypothetical protein [Endomicrobium sp.]